jgi:hypothetical protein
MITTQKLIYFILANAIGFFSVPLCYYIGLSTGALSPSDPNLDINAFRTWFLGGTMLTWMVCCLFSFAYFFFAGKMRLVFLLAPAIAPVAYGLSVLYGSF